MRLIPIAMLLCVLPGCAYHGPLIGTEAEKQQLISEALPQQDNVIEVATDGIWSPNSASLAGSATGFAVIVLTNDSLFILGWDQMQYTADPSDKYQVLARIRKVDIDTIVIKNSIWGTPTGVTLATKDFHTHSFCCTPNDALLQILTSLRKVDGLSISDAKN
jgi:hypothetical protein